jgi:hypothetical protein
METVEIIKIENVVMNETCIICYENFINVRDNDYVFLVEKK